MLVVAVVLVVIIVVMLLLLLALVIALAGGCPCLCYTFCIDSTTWNGDAVFSLIVGGTCIPSRNFMGGARTWQMRACIPKQIHGMLNTYCKHA